MSEIHSEGITFPVYGRAIFEKGFFCNFFMLLAKGPGNCSHSVNIINIELKSTFFKLIIGSIEYKKRSILGSCKAKKYPDYLQRIWSHACIKKRYRLFCFAKFIPSKPFGGFLSVSWQLCLRINIRTTGNSREDCYETSICA